jgi:hypothetical protein
MLDADDYSLSIRTKYNVLGYKFTCFHECHEWKWGVCGHCRSRHRCKNGVRPVYPSEEGIYYPIEMFQVSLEHSEDLGFYVHEFTEATIIQLFNKFRQRWNKDIHFDGYKPTYIVHFVTLYGTNNGKCLDPSTKRNHPRW